VAASQIFSGAESSREAVTIRRPSGENEADAPNADARPARNGRA